MKKLLLYVLLCSSALFAIQPLPKLDKSFFQDDFQAIIRFKMLAFNDEDALDTNSLKTLQAIILRVKEIEKTSKLKVTLVGHCYNAKEYYPDTRNNSIVYKEPIRNTNDKSALYVAQIKEKMIEAGLERNLLYTYSKGGTLLAFSDETPQSGELSNRVMVSIYVLKPEDIDSDKDGVYDRFDRCIGTPRGSKVDQNGCPVDSDGDGVLDYKDKCPGTPPKGVSVDAHGCPLDSDKDGIVDYKDKCENTPQGIPVDPHGCSIHQTLKLHFKSNSDKILKESYGAIRKFADYLKKHPAYKVKITGHTDSRGKAVLNMKLSIARAKAVKKALIAEGIDASRLFAAGRGELDPIQSNRTEEGRRANRRIEIELFY